jgi:hypothetical protein
VTSTRAGGLVGLWDWTNKFEPRCPACDGGSLRRGGGTSCPAGWQNGRRPAPGASAACLNQSGPWRTPTGIRPSRWPLWGSDICAVAPVLSPLGGRCRSPLLPPYAMTSPASDVPTCVRWDRPSLARPVASYQSNRLGVAPGALPARGLECPQCPMQSVRQAVPALLSVPALAVVLFPHKSEWCVECTGHPGLGISHIWRKPKHIHR